MSHKVQPVMTRAFDATFSLTARCPQTGHLGVVVATARPAVGNRVPHVLAGVGASASQASTNPTLSVQALQLVAQGVSVQDALTTVLDNDKDKDMRQLTLMDVHGQCAAFTGDAIIEHSPWAGTLQGKDCMGAGNILVSEETLIAMVTTFEQSTGYLGQRLVLALVAGQKAGGDARGKISAALNVSAHPSFAPQDVPWPLTLRVDMADEPAKELHKLYTEYFRLMGFEEQ